MELHDTRSHLQQVVQRHVVDKEEIIELFQRDILGAVVIVLESAFPDPQITGEVSIRDIPEVLPQADLAPDQLEQLDAYFGSFLFHTETLPFYVCMGTPPRVGWFPFASCQPDVYRTSSLMVNPRASKALSRVCGECHIPDHFV